MEMDLTRLETSAFLEPFLLRLGHGWLGQRLTDGWRKEMCTENGISRDEEAGHQVSI